jgi:hypothetical protein
MMLTPGMLSVDGIQGQFRWKYDTEGGATFLGPLLYKTRAAAMKAGQKWMADQMAAAP